MGIKQFLKPDRRKIVIFVVLTIILSLYQGSILAGELPVSSRGFPLPIFVCIESFSDVFMLTPLMEPCGIIYYFLIIDLIIYYLLSCLIIWFYDKVKKRIR